MILIDDAGWGSMIGGVIIGIYREETQEFLSEEIGVEYFQDEAFQDKLYLLGAARVALDLLDELEVSKNEQIKICTGHCLDGIATALASIGYNFTRGKITGPLQDMIEHSLRTVLEYKYGFKVTYEELTELSMKGLFWWKQIAWLKDGNVNARKSNHKKISQCKTGWATFKIWATHPYAEAKILATRLKSQLKNEKRRCLNYV